MKIRSFIQGRCPSRQSEGSY